RYVIVAEMRGFHGSLSTAQAIPDVPYAGVLGKLRLGDKIDLYRVVVEPGTLALKLASNLGNSGLPAALQLWAFDALGNVSARPALSAGVLSLKLDSHALGLEAGSTIEVGVLSNAGGRNDAPQGYQLWFLRESEPVPVQGEPSSEPILAGGVFPASA